MINKTLKILKSPINDLQHYEAFIQLGDINIIDDCDKYKTKNNQMPNCTAKVWLVNLDNQKFAFSESRFINSLIYLIELTKGDFESIGDVLKEYQLGKYFSSFRKSNLESLYTFLTS